VWPPLRFHKHIIYIGTKANCRYDYEHERFDGDFELLAIAVMPMPHAGIILGAIFCGVKFCFLAVECIATYVFHQRLHVLLVLHVFRHALKI